MFCIIGLRNNSSFYDRINTILFLGEENYEKYVYTVNISIVYFTFYNNYGDYKKMELVRLRSPDPSFLNERGGGAYLINGGLYGAALNVASIANTTMLLSIGYRNMLSKVLTGLKAIPIFGTVTNVLILSSLILKAVDIALNCKAASYMVSGMMFMSAIILGLGAIVSHFVNPLAAYVLSVGAISVLKSTIDTANCRKP